MNEADGIIHSILAFKDKERRNFGKTYPIVVTKGELEFLKAGSPSMADWYDANSIIVEPMVTHDYDSPARLLGRYIPNEGPVLNRADRRRKQKKRK